MTRVPTAVAGPARAARPAQRSTRPAAPGDINDSGSSPGRAAISPTPLDRLRGICLALPQAVEKETWETPTFRIQEKIFAMVHAVDGRLGVWCKAPAGVQAILVEAAPQRFFRPPYVGPKGWIGIWLDDPNWQELADLIARSWRMTAPKRLAAAVANSLSENNRPSGKTTVSSASVSRTPVPAEPFRA